MHSRLTSGHDQSFPKLGPWVREPGSRDLGTRVLPRVQPLPGGMGASSFWHFFHPFSLPCAATEHKAAWYSLVIQSVWPCMALCVVQKHYWPKSNLHGPKPDVIFTLSSVWDANLLRLENWLCCCRSSRSHPCGRSMMRVEWKVLQCLTDMFLAFSRANKNLQ